MPFPTTTALPLLSGDMRARVRAHTVPSYPKSFELCFKLRCLFVSRGGTWGRGEREMGETEKEADLICDFT